MEKPTQNLWSFEEWGAIQCVVQKSSEHGATKLLKLNPHKIRDVQQPFPLTHKPLLLVA
jgi:hypothetical protein